MKGETRSPRKPAARAGRRGAAVRSTGLLPGMRARVQDSYRQGNRLVPLRWTLLACAGLFAVTGVYAASLNGSLKAPVEAVSSALATAGTYLPLRISAVEISGVDGARAKQVAAAIAAVPGDFIFAVNTHKARRRVEKLAWVKQANVRRFLPDVIRVQVVARQPFAVWQHDGEPSIIDRQGRIIAAAKAADYEHLPLFVGQGANLEAYELERILAARPEIKARVRAAVRVAGRRWNIRTRNGIDILLPAEGVAEAIDALAAMNKSHQLLDRAIAKVDLRLGDRIGIQLPEGAGAMIAPPARRKAAGEGAET